MEKSDKKDFHKATEGDYQFLYEFFEAVINQTKTDYFTKGFGEGYEAGFKKTKEYEQKYREMYGQPSVQTVGPENPTADGERREGGI